MRIRDKFAASRRKGMWMGGTIPLGYVVKDRKLVVNETEAATMRLIFARYLARGCVARLREDLEQSGVRSKRRILMPLWTTSPPVDAVAQQVIEGATEGRAGAAHGQYPDRATPPD